MTKRKKTDAEFKKEVYDLVGDEYTFLDKYVNSKTKLRVKHITCGNTYKVDPNHFFTGNRCPYCYGTPKKTNTQFKQKVYNLVGDEYVFLDTYIDNKTKIRVKHNKCGNIYDVRPYSFFQGTRCPYCFGTPKKTNAQFKQEVFDLVGGEYTFLECYQGASTKIKVKHNKCGHIYKVRPNDFLKGNRCHYCNGGVKKSDKRFKQEVMSLVGNEYAFLDSYVNSATKLRVKHNKCGHIYKVIPSAFLSGKRCPYCYSNIKKTDAQFKQEVHDLVGDEYVFLDSYINSHTKLKVKHNRCGNVYEVRPYSFLEGYGCPYCSSPKGEVVINNMLKSLNIRYEYQKTFNDLSDDRLLSYDFYIPDQNILIEYQGIQHYEPVDYFGGNVTFKRQQKHDKMKSDYAKAHNYKLIDVPYTVDTFSKIKKYLIKHGLKLH